MPSHDKNYTDANPSVPDSLVPARVIYSETAEVHVREDGSRRVVPITDASKPPIPELLRQSWRNRIDALQHECGVTATVVVQITRAGLCVVATSANPENPYCEGMTSPLGDGRYCEAVIGKDSLVAVADAASSPIWHDCPDSTFGIESYCGIPLHWTDGSFFGSLCILDRRMREPSAEFVPQIQEACKAIESDLESLVQENSLDAAGYPEQPMDAMFRYAPGGIFSYSAEADERFSYISVNMLSFLGYTEDEFREKFENRFSLMVWHEDRERALAEIDEQISHGSFDTCEYRIEKKDGSIVWVHDEGHIVTDENGKRWFFVVIVDITDTIDAQRKLVERNRELEKIAIARQSTLDDIPGGVRVFVKGDNGIVCVNANQYYADMMGVSKEELIGETFGRNALRIHPDDRLRHRTETVEDLDLNNASEGTYRFINAKTGEYRWYHVEAALRVQPDGSQLAYFHYTDVDDLKRAEAEVQADQKRFKLAVKGAHLAVWEYDIASKRMILPEGEGGDSTRDHYGFSGNAVEDVPESMFPLLLSDEDRERLAALYEEVESGTEYTTADIWFRKSPDAEPRCDRLTYYVEKDALGKPSRAYGIGADITAQKQEQARFHQSIQSILSANPAALCTFQVNLTQNVCYEGHGISPFILKTLRSETASGLFGKCLEIIPYERDRQLFHSVFDLDALVASFTAGKPNQHIDYRRTDAGGNIRWVRTFVSMLKNPETGDIEGAIYSIDISHEKRRDDVFDMLTGQEYELIALLDLDTGRVEAFHLGDSLPQSYESVFHETGNVCDFDRLRASCVGTWVAEDERQKYLDGTDPDYIRRALNRNGRYELTVRGEVPGRGTVYRKLQHYYLDDEKRQVLIASSDVTLSYLEQQREMEEKRRAQLERTLVDMIGSLPANYVLYREDDSGMFVPERYSDEFCRMKGCTQDDIRKLNGQNGFAPVHPDDRRALEDAVLASRDDDDMHHAEYRILTFSGDYKWVSVNYSHFAIGEQHYLYAVYTDVDELKRQERQLTEQYNAAQEYLDSVASTYLSTGRANLSRNTIEESSGDSTLIAAAGGESLTYDAYLGYLLNGIMVESDRERCARTFDRRGLIDAFNRGERMRSVVFRMRSWKGEICWVKDSLSLTKHPDTGDVILFSAASDVTQEELTRAIMDEVLPRQYDYISCIDSGRDEVMLFRSGDDASNRAGIVAGMGFTQSERDYCEGCVVADDRDRYMEFVSLPGIIADLAEGKRHIDSFSIDEGSGQRIVQVEFFYIDQESGLIATSRTDITDAQRRQLEQEETLRTALASAERANAAKSDFLSRMSHDMRTPLNGIIGMTYLTEEMEMPEAVRENLSKIDTSSKFLLGLINDILDMTKAESNEVDLHYEPYAPSDFYKYLDAVIRPLCDDKHQTFVMHANPPEDVEPLFDRLRINQVVFNLLSNAVKFTPEGGTITYDARFGERDGQGRIPLHITVSDNGIGMNEAFQEVLFEPFTQEERADATGSRGTGLGLAIVKKLVELMGGTISVKSAVGSGTEFDIDMIVNSIPKEEGERRGETGAGQSDHNSLEGRHVLLCEDHILNQEIAVALLNGRGMIVEVADNGERGVELFISSPDGFYDAVLMDIRMPVMDGYQAARRIRSLDRADAGTVPIFAMTADAFADDVQRCLDAGMNGHVAKPIDPQVLYRTLEDAISGR